MLSSCGRLITRFVHGFSINRESSTICCKVAFPGVLAFFAVHFTNKVRIEGHKVLYSGHRAVCAQQPIDL